jgi:excinuclease ABC subunit A
MKTMKLRGARIHNLKGINLDLDLGELIAVTGPSGAGKSSLVMDTLYAEGQRRFVESFSPYARQFLERLPKPMLDELAPVAPAVAIERRSQVKSSRSTLATLADLEVYLAAVFAKAAAPVCKACGVLAQTLDAELGAKQLLRESLGEDLLFSYKTFARTEDEYLALRESLTQDGYRRIVVSDQLTSLDEVRPSAAIRAPIGVVTDRVRLEEGSTARIREALEVAWQRGGNQAVLHTMQAPTAAAGKATQGSSLGITKTTKTLLKGLGCPNCGIAIEPPKADLFSYNSPRGACEPCKGFGRIIAVDWQKVIPDHALSIEAGVIKAWTGKSADWERAALLKYAAKHKISVTTPWRELSEADRERILEGDGEYGGGKYPGVRAWFRWLETRTYKMHVRVFLARYREYVTCETCQGGRLRKTSLNYRVGGLDLPAWHRLTVQEAQARMATVACTDPQARLAQKELGARLQYLQDVGLGYLALDRQARTLSGGETQRASLTTALGATLTHTMFAIDEPTVGLHPMDVPPLALVLKRLAAAGNTVLVVEHDEAVVAEASRVIELGPGPASKGGSITYDGPPSDRLPPHDQPKQGPADSVERQAPVVFQLAPVNVHNLNTPAVAVPLHQLVVLCGPSGSGKSTFLRQGLLAQAEAALNASQASAKAALRSTSAQRVALKSQAPITRVVLVDQGALGRTARGNAATYTYAWDRLRARFSRTPQAAAHGLTNSNFSFNVAAKRGKGRCEECAGEGFETVEMQFLADVQIECASCGGKRFGPLVLDVSLLGKTIAEVLAMTCAEVLAHFDSPEEPDYVLRRALGPLIDVGLGYLPLGQPLSTLSGGEAQRLKLARALGEDEPGTLFLIDEPSAGLAPEDLQIVLSALRKLVDKRSSVIAIDHDLSVIEAADHVLELGPGGGPAGGQLVFQGSTSALRERKTKTAEAFRARSERASSMHKRATKNVRSRSNARPPETGIEIAGAREHTLKNVSCTIPHGKVTVVTGPSGSGKSSLAFDVVFAEGQRRFIETLTPYARQFLPTLPRPEVDSVVGIPPAIALEQRTTRAGANSTVATVTEVAHFLRLLFAKLGTLKCRSCGEVVSRLAKEEVTALLRGSAGKGTLYAPAVFARKGTHLDIFTQAARRGIKTARVDGKIVTIDPPPKLAKAQEHTVDLIVSYGSFAALDDARLDDALQLGHGLLRYHAGEPRVDRAKDAHLSTQRACASCGTGAEELDPRHFSFNTKQGQCPSCEGRGTVAPPEDKRKADENAAPLSPCKACRGARLGPLARSVSLQGKTYPEITELSAAALRRELDTWVFEGRAALIGGPSLVELRQRLDFVLRIGLGYLALARSAATLSGGEMQRLRLAAQLGSGLTGTLYVLDEPTIGLHPRDTERLTSSLRALADLGASVLVVEHDEDVIRKADHVIDMGPVGGRMGGSIVAQGTGANVLADPGSPTGQALSVRPSALRACRTFGARDPAIELRGAAVHNLKNVDVSVPMGSFTVVAGVSGSGKSTLVSKVLYPALRKQLGLVASEPGAHKKLNLPKDLRRVIAVDQAPLGRTSRSTPATFLGIWDEIRKLFATVPDAQVRGYKAGRFSFNAASGGRCSACDGAGVLVSEMSFMPDVVTLCEGCAGKRFDPATLEVRYREKSIGDVLLMTADEAASYFEHHPRIARPLSMLRELGVGYIQLGQGSHTLSGGEAQRLKLASELTATSMHQKTLYVLDEPTTGLHLSDVRRLVGVLDALVARGDTLVIVEHHPEVIRNADHVIELGPEGGQTGGQVVFQGTVAAMRKAKTATSKYL